MNINKRDLESLGEDDKIAKVPRNDSFRLGTARDHHMQELKWREYSYDQQRNVNKETVSQSMEQKQDKQKIELHLEKAIKIVTDDRKKYNLFIKQLVKDVKDTYGEEEVQSCIDEEKEAMRSDRPELQSSPKNFTEDIPTQEQDQNLRKSSELGCEEREAIIRGYLTYINKNSTYPAIAELTKKRLEEVLEAYKAISHDISNQIDISDQSIDKECLGTTSRSTVLPDVLAQQERQAMETHLSGDLYVSESVSFASSSR